MGKAQPEPLPLRHGERGEDEKRRHQQRAVGHQFLHRFNCPREPDLLLPLFLRLGCGGLFFDTFLTWPRRPRPNRREADRFPSSLLCLFHFIFRIVEVLQIGQVELKPGGGNDLHPIPVRGLVGSLRAPGLDRDVRIARAEIARVRIRLHPFERFIDTDTLIVVAFEVRGIEPPAVPIVAGVHALVHCHHIRLAQNTVDDVVF